MWNANPKFQNKCGPNFRTDRRDSLIQIAHGGPFPGSQKQTQKLQKKRDTVALVRVSQGVLMATTSTFECVESLGTRRGGQPDIQEGYWSQRPPRLSAYSHGRNVKGSKMDSKLSKLLNIQHGLHTIIRINKKPRPLCGGSINRATTTY